MVKYAFTMIELIFAIVIIGIVAISIPIIMVTNSKNVEQNLMQEAVLIATTKMDQILTYPWDDRSRDITGFVLAKTEVLDLGVASPLTPELDRNASDFRVGHFQEALRRKMVPAAFSGIRPITPVANLGKNAWDQNLTTDNDIDDFDGQFEDLFHAGADNYKNDYRITADVSYVDDTIDYTQVGTTEQIFDFDHTPYTLNPTHIKRVEINVTKRDSAGNLETTPSVVFRAFATNIGETDYYQRTY
jgi:prepilin-type N-terminal cleavage/methylation domain-containing protein